MILVLDACTISNLVHVFQNDSLLKNLPLAFNDIFIVSEVIKEVKDTKDDYRIYYPDKWDDLEALYSSMSLNRFLNKEDALKFKYKQTLIKFFNYHNSPFKQNGEFFSSLLSLHISRLGKENIPENTYQLLFATDDAKAKTIYQSFFTCNQIGNIISSVDVVIILYLNDIITKNKVLTYIEGLYPLYSKEINTFKNHLKKIINKEKDPIINLGLSTLDEYLSNGEFEELFDTINSASFRKTFKKYEHLKLSLKTIPFQSFREKVDFLKMRHDEFKHDLVWKD